MALLVGIAFPSFGGLIPPVTLLPTGLHSRISSGSLMRLVDPDLCLHGFSGWQDMALGIDLVSQAPPCRRSWICHVLGLVPLCQLQLPYRFQG